MVISIYRYVKKSFPLKVHVLTDVLFLDLRRLPPIGEGVPVDFVSEITDYQLCKQLPVPTGDTRVDAVWNDIEQISDLNGQPRFPHMCKVASYLLLIPHSNAYTARPCSI